MKRFYCNNLIALFVVFAIACTLSLPAKAQELVTNGGFELPVANWGTTNISNAVPGWTRGVGSLGSAIEIQNHAAGSPFAGNQHCELDSYGVTAIFQNLGTTPGASYILRFAFSPRPGVMANTMRIFWNGTLIDTLSVNGKANSDTVWTVHTYTLTATSGSTRLAFDNLTEVSDSVGSYLDAVSVVPDQTKVTVSGTVTLESSARQTHSLFFGFRPVNGGEPFFRSLTLQQKGDFSLNDIPHNRYSVWIKGSKWLAKAVVIDTTKGDVTNMNALLRAGDANNDNFVDVLDLDVLISAFGSAFGKDRNWNDGADLNCDGWVDVLDLDLLIQNFDTAGDF